jgi:hypothetical protein
MSVLRSQKWGTLGLEARGRAAIGAQTAPNSAVEPTVDAVAGPIAMVSLGSLVLFAEVGPSAVKLRASGVQWGVSSLGGIASVF